MTASPTKAGSTSRTCFPTHFGYPAIKAFVANGRVTGLLLLVMILPNLVWVCLHRGLWPADACANGLKATSLYYALISDKVSWWQAMSLIGARRPPLLAWIAQFLVPVGNLIGSIDVGLLLLPMIAQFVTLLLTYKALDAVFKSRALALLGCLFIASAPVLIDVGKQLQTQPMQLVAAAWFLYIMCHARKWNSVTTVLNVVAASAFAMLTMLSTPAFGLVPGVVALYEAWKKGRSGIVMDRSQIPLFVTGLLLAFLALLWSHAHARGVLTTASTYYHFPWGARVEDVFHLKLLQWLDFLRHGFTIFPTFALGGAVGLWALSSYAMARDDRKKNEARVALHALGQVILLLVIFASSQQQTFRYVLPFAPFLSLLVVWSVFQVRRQWISFAVAGTLVLQFALVQARDFGLVRFDRRYGEGTTLQTSRDSRFDLIDEILRVVSADRVAPVMLEMRALSMDGEQVSFEASKRPEFTAFFENIVTGRTPPVHSVDKVLVVEILGREALPGRGDGDARTRAGGDALWESFLKLDLGYFVMPRRDIRRKHFEYVKDATVGPLVAERFSIELAEKVAESALFERVPTPSHPELEIYKYR